jgi:hypothetical protein
MAANGVIGITASILESSDIPESENNPENQKSFFERIKGWVKGLSKNWKGMVKKGATAGFYALLAGSKIMQGITQSMFRIVGALIDVLLAPMIPFISKGINWLADIVRAVGDFIKNMPETFKKIWEPIWDWITTLTSSAWETLLNLFKDKGKEIKETDRDKLIAEIIGSDQGPLVGPDEKAGFLEGNNKGYASLIDEPINRADVDEERDRIEENLRDVMPSQQEVTDVQQSYIDAVEKAYALPSEGQVQAAKEQYVAAIQDQFELPSETEVDAIKKSYGDAVEEHLTLPTEAEVIVVQESYAKAVEFPEGYNPYGAPTWMDDVEDSPEHPEMGPINRFHAQMAMDRGDIKLIDEADKLDGPEERDNWIESWKDQIEVFSLEDFFEEMIPMLNPVDAVASLFENTTTTTPEAVVTNLIDAAVGDDAPVGIPIPSTDWSKGERGDVGVQAAEIGGIQDAAYMYLVEQYLLSKK